MDGVRGNRAVTTGLALVVVTSCSGSQRTLLSGPGCLLAGKSSAPVSLGVHARAGECLVNADGAVAPSAHGAPSPEEAIRAAGFGRFRLEPFTPPEPDGLRHLREREGNEIVGSYSVQQVADGSWVVHAYNASTAHPERYQVP